MPNWSGLPRRNGTAGDDTIDGSNITESINGGPGTDTMSGFLGNDLFYVDLATDVVIENAGEGAADRVNASGDYSLSSEAEIEYLVGNAGSTGLELRGNGYSQSIVGLSGNDRLFGLGGSDILAAGSGVNFLAGGEDNDTYIISDGDDFIEEGVGQGIDIVSVMEDFILNRGAEVEIIRSRIGDGSIRVVGNEFGQLIRTGGGNDIIEGGGGNDILDGGYGVNELIGGDGDDVYILSSPHNNVLVLNSIVEGIGGGRDEIRIVKNFVLEAGVEVEVLRGNSRYRANIFGNEFDQEIYGTGRFDRLHGGGGNDIIDGNGGFGDRLFGDAGNDILRNGYYLDGGSGADMMFGGTGNNSFVVDDVADRVIEEINGGFDRVYTSADFDGRSNWIEDIRVTTSSGAQVTVYGGATTVSILGGNGDDTLYASHNGARLNGGGGNDTLYGGQGRDVILGGAGNDRIAGGLGADNMSGGDGHDIFVLEMPDVSFDRISGFDSLFDTLEVSRSEFGFDIGDDQGVPGWFIANSSGLASDGGNETTRFIYSRGLLYFDADGTGAADAIALSVIATIPGSGPLSASDFLVVA